MDQWQYFILVIVCKPNNAYFYKTKTYYSITVLQKLLLTIFVFCGCSANAQDATFNWAKSFGSTGEDIVRKIIRNACGDIYCVGSFSETTDLDPGPGIFNATSKGGRDIYISKFDGFGKLVWSRHIGGSGNDEAATIVNEQSGDIFITGVFQGIVDFDPGTGTAMLDNGAEPGAFLLKIDTAGNFLWVKQLTKGKGSIYSSHTISVAPSGNMYVTGTFNGTVDLDPGPAVHNVSSAGSSWDDIFISKFNGDGDFIWGKQFTGMYYKASTGIETDAMENIFITGGFAGTVDFDPGPAVYNLTSTAFSVFPDIFAARLDTDGNLVWAKKMGGNNSAQARTMIMDAQDNIYISGDFYGHIDFDPGPGFFYLDAFGGYPACFIVKLTSDGALEWAQRFGGQNGSGSSATGIDIALDVSENIYVSGTFSGNVDFSPLLTLTSANPGSDLFVMKLLNDGNCSYVKQMGGANAQSSGISVFVDLASNIYVGGVLYGAAVDYDPDPGVYNLTSNGVTDAFLLKLSQCNQPTTATIIKTICSGTPSYTVDCKTYTTSGVYSQVLINATGCDSIVTLDLKFGDNPVPELGPDKEQCKDSANFFLLQTQENYADYEWSTGLTTPTISVQNIGEYWVKVKDAIGCEGSDTINIIPKQCVIDLYMPSAFSPNDDHLNDVLKPGVYGTLVSFKMEVYNRYGQVIFQSNDANKGWDGKFKGKAAPIGVYVWQCYYQFQNKALEYQKGTVTIIR